MAIGQVGRTIVLTRSALDHGALEDRHQTISTVSRLVVYRIIPAFSCQ
jgi:hypothetical protein